MTSLRVVVVFCLVLAGCGAATEPASKCRWVITKFQDTTWDHRGGKLVHLDSVQKCLTPLDYY